MTHPRWEFTHAASAVVWRTKGRAQYVHAALSVACSEGFGHAVLTEGHGFPTLNEVTWRELPEDSDEVESTPDITPAPHGEVEIREPARVA